MGYSEFKIELEPSPSQALMYSFPEGVAECRYPVRKRMDHTLFVGLEKKVDATAQGTFNGLKLTQEELQNPDTRKLYPGLPPKGYVQTYTNEDPEKQRLFYVWSDRPDEKIDAIKIKIYWPINADSYPVVLP